MFLKSGKMLPNAPRALSDLDLATMIGAALRDELGNSHRAAKTIMAWTGGSERSARGWLNGEHSPSALHLIALAAKCSGIMTLVLHLAGQERAALAIDIAAIEQALEASLDHLRGLVGEAEE